MVDERKVYQLAYEKQSEIVKQAKEKADRRGLLELIEERTALQDLMRIKCMMLEKEFI